MQARRYRRWLTAAALAITPVLGVRVASAQYAASSGGGHALDANNQVGSGGINGTVSNSLITGNDIVYGNVTGGRGLDGNFRTRELDPTAFRGILPGAGIDSFVAGSNSAPTAYSPTFSLSQPRAFYGSSRGVAPPVGTVLLGSSGSAIGTSLTPANPYAATNTASADDLAGIRAGTTNIIGVPGGSNNSFLVLPGGQDSSYANLQSVLAASPLYGLKYTTGAGATAFNDSLTNPTPGTLAPGSYDANSLNNFQQQLRASTPSASQLNPNLNDQSTDLTNGSNGNGSGNNGTSSQSNPYKPSTGDPRLNGATGNRINGTVGGTPLEMPLNSPVGSGRLNDAASSTQLGTYHESPNGIQLVSPGTYSPQYKALQNALDRYRVQTKPAAAVGKNGKPLIAPSTTQPSTVTPPGTPAAPAVKPGGNGAELVKISSIAGTVTSPKARGLHDILAKADDALKNDQFKSAIDQFNAASFVAPNNQMIALGRANANLAAGYYATAEQDIRRAVSADAAVLMAQMDLGSMISSHRLDFVKKDLKDLADKNPKESRPWFLLAYINYNTGDEQAAANDLEAAKQRSGSLDISIQLMQQYWQLPAPDASVQKQELNK
jgi:hypothetical protein